MWNNCNRWPCAGFLLMIRSAGFRSVWQQQFIVPDEQVCHRGPSIFMLSSSTSLRSVLTPHWVIPQCIQTEDGGGDWSHTKEDAVLERPQLDPFNQRGYKRHRSILGHCVPIPTGDRLKETPEYIGKEVQTGHEELLNSLMRRKTIINNKY